MMPILFCKTCNHARWDHDEGVGSCGHVDPNTKQKCSCVKFVSIFEEREHHMHTKADYTLQDALAGGTLIYQKLTGGTVDNAAVWYGAVDVLGYGGNYIPSSSAPPKGAVGDAKKELIALLKPVAEEQDATKKAALNIDWAKIIALVVQLLPIILGT